MEETKVELIEEEIVIIGAGIAGLSTALGLHRLGLKSLVLESSDSLRVSGFALTLWTNAWRALDALGVADSLRIKFPQIQGFELASAHASTSTPQSVAADCGLNRPYECRCVERKELLETLAKELPHGTIRFSSKLLSIHHHHQQSTTGFKSLQLSDGSVINTKVLIGCDGVNSQVAKWLGLKNPVKSNRSAIRGLLQSPPDGGGHGLEPRFHVYFGGGVRFGFVPCNNNSLYWFCTFTPSSSTSSSGGKEEEFEEGEAMKMKQFVLNKARNAPKEMLEVVERTGLDAISCSELKLRPPWNLLTGNIVKDNVCVAGDALHPMTPDIGQGGCSALEDSVILARCIGEAMMMKTNDDKLLEKYGKERRWRSFWLISAAYMMGVIQESGGKVTSFIREKVLPGSTIGALVYMADFHCGKLTTTESSS
ncbi:monooxygenase 2-like [Impatiens glandulifera]|uniref:monooxygenase 2-like n=1 Tax=Impatiens glandulifera TaxID=253017 RepID=UPI001FB15D4E|nr:monooxygenase 2-like [Impatiens glandulifera]